MNWLPTSDELSEAQQNWKPVMQCYAVYVLWDGYRSYYVGATASYKKRIESHQAGEGAKTTRRWFTEGRPIKEYWRIDVPANTCSWTFGGKHKNSRKPKLSDLEHLVLKTLKRQNPGCCVTM